MGGTGGGGHFERGRAVSHARPAGGPPTRSSNERLHDSPLSLLPAQSPRLSLLPARPAHLPAGMAPSDEPLPDYCLPFEGREAGEARVRILTRRPLVPSAEEQAANARSRSAKLRVVEKL